MEYGPRIVAKTHGGDIKETMELGPTMSPLNKMRGQRGYVSGPVVGRQKELALLHETLLQIETSGAAIIVRGDIGVGKSALLEEVRRHAAEKGFCTVTVAGAQSETHLAFASLQQVLSPALVRVDKLPTPQRSALQIALGMEEGETPEFLHIALASLELLSEMATTAPLLLVVDDAQWLDEATCDVLMFVARRLAYEPILMLFGVRDVSPVRIARAGLPELELRPLNEAASELLLDSTAPNLTAFHRRGVLAEALGNPLALIELPMALETSPDTSATPVPLTERLERAFSARILGLSSATRKFLLVAALDMGGALGRLTSAASLLEGEEVGFMEVSASVAAGVIESDSHGIRFRHPLVRSAVYQAAGDSDRRAAHMALAQVYSDEIDRSVWHQAAGLVDPSDDIADDLELLATRAERRGAPDVAVLALQRAARLTTDDTRRGAFLLRAARLAFELGQFDVSRRLVDRAQQLELAPEDQQTLIYMLERYGQHLTWSGAARIDSLIEIAESRVAAGETESALDVLEVVAMRCWWGNPDQDLRNRVVAAAELLPIPHDSPKILAILAQADPVGQGAAVQERITRMAPDAATPVEMYLVAVAANATWDFESALRFLDPAVAGLRAQGRMNLLAEALVLQAWAAVHLAREPLAVAAAGEATRLALETGQVHWAASAQLAMAAIEAERGDLGAAEVIVRAAEAQLLQIGATPMLALAQFVRGRGEIAHQRYEEGIEHLRRVLDPADPAHNPFIGAWGLSDLVDASVHAGQTDRASAYMQELESLASATPGSFLRATEGYARAIIADDDSAEVLYRRAIERDLANWPCYRGRMLLWYGRWLRRQRRVTESWVPLRAALETFDALAFPALADIARLELRSTGEAPNQRKPETWTQLSPQELQIAQLAAQGQTNREIAQKLFLSHRTVEYHLHRIFPKLGITRRSHLRESISGALVGSEG